MELTHDWKNFQTFFYKREKSTQAEEARPIFVVADGAIVISVFAQGEDFTDWIGATYDEMVAELGHREIILYRREQVDRWIIESANLTHFQDQIDFLRQEAKPELVHRKKAKMEEFRAHFLLQAIQTWWERVFPSTYGIYIQLDGNKSSSLLLIVQRGKLASFYRPDFSQMIKDQQKNPNEVIKYLSERYLVPVQGIFVSSEEWTQWSEASHPWGRIMEALKKDRTKLVPFKWSLAGLIASRAFFGV